MQMAKHELAVLALDAYRGIVPDFNKVEASEALRQEFIKIVGTDKPGFREFRAHGPALYAILEEVLNEVIVEGFDTQFNDFIEYRNIGWGDEKRFTLRDKSLFRVASVASGTGNLRRQRLDSGYFMVETAPDGIKIYEEFLRFLAGRIDWAEMVNRVAASFNQRVLTKVYDAIVDSHSALNATFGITGTFDETKMDQLIAHVEAASNSQAVVWGTKFALNKVTPATEMISDEMRNQWNKVGYFTNYKGTVCRELKQAHKPGTFDWAIDNNFLLVLPTGGERIVKLVDEGHAIIQETQGGITADMSLEHTFIKYYGVGVIASHQYGIYKFA